MRNCHLTDFRLGPFKKYTCFSSPSHDKYDKGAVFDFLAGDQIGGYMWILGKLNSYFNNQEIMDQQTL